MSDFWTPARVEQLRAWWTSGRRSSGEIASEWGVSRDMIMGKIKRLGLLGQGRTHGGGAHGKWTAEMDARLRSLIDAGTRHKGISKELGVSVKAVGGRLQRLGIQGQHGCNRGPSVNRGGKGRLTAHLPGDGKFKGAVDWRKRIERVEPTTPDSTRELRGCRWIDGDVLTGDWRCCQAETPFGSSWCRAHHARVFLPGTAFDARKVKAA